MAGPLNEAYFTSLTASANGAQSCSELQTLSAQATAAVTALNSAIAAQTALLAPMEALLTPPGASLTAIVTYLETFISAYLTPQLVASATYAAKLTALTAAAASLTAAISAKAGTFTDCTIS